MLLALLQDDAKSQSSYLTWKEGQPQGEVAATLRLDFLLSKERAPALIFALGLYLPLELNTPALVGGFLAHYLGRRAEKTGGARGAAIRERGVIIASGGFADHLGAAVRGPVRVCLAGVAALSFRLPVRPGGSECHWGREDRKISGREDAKEPQKRA